LSTAKNLSIDAEHRVQVGLLELVCSAVESGREAAEVGEILEQLVDYTRAHFMSEELLMRLDSYDDFDEHVEDHGQMLEVLDAMLAAQQTGQGDLLPGKAKSLLTFLLRHIETRDARYASWTPV
jgi:hemerythrin